MIDTGILEFRTCMFFLLFGTISHCKSHVNLFQLQNTHNPYCPIVIVFILTTAKVCDKRYRLISKHTKNGLALSRKRT